MARPGSSLARSAARSTPSRAGKSKRSGGTSRSSASTGRRCSTTTFCASCTTTSAATNGSSSAFMTSDSERQRDEVRLSPGGPCLRPEHCFAAPVAQRSVLVEKQRVGGEELVEVHDLRPVRHCVGDEPHPEP